MLEGIHQLCLRHPGLRHRHEKGRDVIEGEVEINHKYTPEDLHVVDSFIVQIELSNNPAGYPTVKELQRKIPHKVSWHVFPEGHLCLGSPLRLHLSWAKSERNIYEFVLEFLEPFLFAASARLNGYDGYIFGELAHGKKGIVNDYKTLFGVATSQQVTSCLQMLIVSQSTASRMACPCRCHKQARQCETGNRILSYRALVGKGTAKRYLKNIQGTKLPK